MSSSFHHFTPLVAGTVAAPDSHTSLPGCRHGEFLKALTVKLVETYSTCSSEFTFKREAVPRRVLTKPYEAAHNNGYDNSEFDYICRVRDTIESESGSSYEILDWLGRGTFGQVLKCQVRDASQRLCGSEFVALKVIKNKPAYTEQARMEVNVLQKLNEMFEPTEEDRLLRMIEHFTFRKHLCIAFELLHESLYQVLQRRGHRGLSLTNTKLVTGQLLEALMRLREASIIHCDLKPENVMLSCLNPIRIKLIDFGSACREDQPLHSYIQSRFYRAPEVIIGMKYTRAIDIWSLGCICAEVFRGLPIFPGITGYDQLRRVVKVLGAPPEWMLRGSRHGEKYFQRDDEPLLAVSQPELTSEKPGCTAASLSAGEREGEPDSALCSGGGASTDGAGSTATSKTDKPEGTPEQAPAEPDSAGATSPQVGRRGWRIKSPDEFKRDYPPRDERRRQQLEEKGLVPSASHQEKEIKCLDHLLQLVESKVARETSEEAWLVEQERRQAFRQFLGGMLSMCPEARWTPGQAQKHPFVTGAPHVADFRPAKDEDVASRTMQIELGSLDFHPPHRHYILSSTTVTPASSPHGSVTSAHMSDSRGSRGSHGSRGNRGSRGRNRGSRGSNRDSSDVGSRGSNHPHSPWHLASDVSRSSGRFSGSESSRGSSGPPSGTGTDSDHHGEAPREAPDRRPTLAEVAQTHLLPKRPSPGAAGGFRQSVGMSSSGPVVPPRQRGGGDVRPSPGGYLSPPQPGEESAGSARSTNSARSAPGHYSAGSWNGTAQSHSSAGSAGSGHRRLGKKGGKKGGKGGNSA